MRVPQEQSSSLFQNQNNNRNQNLSKREELGQRILMYLRNAFWVILAVVVIYYSNFFHNLFKNPNINPFFFQISMTGYAMLIILILYTTFALPLCFGVNSVEQHNPKLVSIGAIIGVISVISLLIAIWPVWGFFSLLIFISLWKGFFGLAVFLPKGHLGSFMFISINLGTVFSFYIIEHEGYLH